MPRLSFGSDPEFMLKDKKGNYKSAIGIVDGGKENKVDLGGEVKTFYDNVLMELNMPVAFSKDDMLAKFSDAFRRASRLIYPFIMVPQASCIYPEVECLHPQAKVFGCDPEYDAYELMQCQPPNCEEGNTFRSGGGHIHLGYDSIDYPLKAKIENEGTDEQDTSERDWGRIWVVRMMDLFIGIPALLIDHDPTSVARRQLYGKAGTHRPKDYGVEYRPTSNFWLQSPKIAGLIYDLSSWVVGFVKEEGHLKLWKDKSECSSYKMDNLISTINKSDKNRAKRYMEETIKKYLPSNLYAEIFKQSEPVRYDFYREWSLK